MILGSNSIMKFAQSKSALSILAIYSRTVSGLTTSIHLNDPNLLRVPDVTFHRETVQVLDPGATKKEIEEGSAVIGLVEGMNRKDAKEAIHRSQEALKKWKFHTTASERSKMLNDWSILLKEHTRDLATIMSLESGKPLRESLGEVGYGISFVDYFAAEAIRPSAAGGGYLCPSPFPHIDGSPK